MRFHRLIGCLAFLAVVLLASCSPGAQVRRAPERVSEEEAAAWAERQLGRLTLEEKVSQLFTVWVSGHFQSAETPQRRRLEALVEEFGVGGVIFGLGDPMAQAALTNELQEQAALPLLVSQDMEWGPGMRLERTTTLPPAMALGATRDPELARQAGYVTAREARALGVQQIYAPVADVNNNPDNPIINVRSFGEDPALVAAMVQAFVEGAESGGALATAKHFPGHGDTATDSHLALPVLPFDRVRLDTLELVPFRAAIEAGIPAVMTGHLALPALEPDSTVPATLSPRVTRQLLREELGFDGLIVTDALDMEGVTSHFGVGEVAVRALEAGADVLLMSEDPYVARAAVLEAVAAGRLTEARIDASVRRLLRAKARVGLHRDRMVDLGAVDERVASRRHQVLTDVIARKSLTLLRNEGGLLPLTPRAPRRTLVVTLNDGDDPDVGQPFVQQLRGAAALEALAVRRLDLRSDSVHAAALLDEASDYELVLISSFLRVRAWSGRIGLPALHQAFLDSLLHKDVPAVLVSFGNPYVARALPRQPAAYLAAYGTHAASQVAAAQALLGKSDVSGRLPVTVPGRYAYGAGLTLEQVTPRADLPEAVGMDSGVLAQIDALLHASMLRDAFPGAAFAVGRDQIIARLDGTGYHTYEARTPAMPQSIYDLASLTKIVATTTAAMLLYEEGRLALDAPVARYLPAFAQNGKEDVTVRQLLTHSSGLRPYLAPDERGPTRAALIDTVMAEALRYEPGAKSVYSGLGFITLMRVIETASGQDFISYCEEHIFEPLGMRSTSFYPSGTVVPAAVPTTDTTGTRFQGTVHDPIARRMGGLSGGAGLFSTAEDLTHFATMIVNGGVLYGHRFLDEETIRLFTTRAGVGGGSTRALGWDTKSLEGYSSAGDRFGPESFGHTGYTGTSMWIDPEQDLFVILLTNHVYPDDTSEQIGNVRPQVADLAYEAIVGPPVPLLPVPEADRRTAEAW